MRHIIFTILLGYALLVTGCAFKNDIQQGNVITTTQLDQLATGMTPQQVQFLLGSPLLIDPFHHQRWDYLYSFRAGEQAEVTRYRATLWFEQGRLARVERQGEIPAIYQPPASDLRPES